VQEMSRWCGNVPRCGSVLASHLKEGDELYQLKPLKTYALEAVRDDGLCMTRMERMLDAIGRSVSDIEWISDNNLPEVVEELSELWPPAEVPEGTPPTFMRPLVFTKVHTGEELPDISAKLLHWPDNTNEGTVRAILGQFEAIHAYHPYERDQEENRVCWPTWDFGTMMGCPHGCQYCGAGKSGKFITVGLNLEEFMEVVVPRTIAKYPWQQCFRMIGWAAEMISFEPEYGCFDLYTRKLAEYDKYGYFHAASSNVDWIAELPRKDRLIAIFSVTCEAVARDIEPGTGHAFDRFEAGRKCNEFGVPVRYKFKPMIPVRNWQDEYARAIEQALTVSEPESVGFCVIMWMNLETLAGKIDLDLLDPEYVQAARDAAAEMEGNVCAPFPHHARKAIYQYLIQQVRRWDDEVLLYVSTESREMWDELKDELGQDPRAFFCGCSSVAVPGRKLSLSAGCPHSTYSPLA